MKVVGRNRIRAIKGILASVKEVTYFTHENAYLGKTEKGPLDEKEQRFVLQDIQGGQATMYYNSVDDTYVIKYAGLAHWVIRK